MTTQTTDSIFYLGKRYELFSEPLSSYEGLPNFLSMSSANYRGYEATWSIDEDHLFIDSLSGFSATDGSLITLDSLFLGDSAPIPATWFSGVLLLAHGRVINPGDGLPTYEFEDEVTIDCGLVKSRRSFKREWLPELFLDLTLFLRLEDALEVDQSLLSKLNKLSIFYMGDLISLSRSDLTKRIGVSADEFLQIQEEIVSRGYVLGADISGWPPSTYNYRELIRARKEKMKRIEI